MLEEHLSLWKAEDALKEGLKAARGAPSQVSLEKARSLVPVLRHILGSSGAILKRRRRSSSPWRKGSSALRTLET